KFDDLAARFAEALASVGGETIQAESLDAALDCLGELLQSLDAKRVVANDEPPLSDRDLPARWPEIEWQIVGRTAGDLRAFSASADVGLSGGDAALAETGSVVVSSGPGKSRLATLLPPVHVALVSTTKLATDIFTWTTERQKTRPASMTVITGPSKTADIEQVLAIGVHGPKRFVVILYRA
ncbi:MAG TPA: lactate utilization protein, partial [Aggregatilineales bacterium]|nr:lactate utilization protein [Aggregatilineales bacterium]